MTASLLLLSLPPFNAEGTVSGYFSSCLFCNIHWGLVSKRGLQEEATLQASFFAVKKKKKKVAAQKAHKYFLGEEGNRLEGSNKIDQAPLIQPGQKLPLCFIEAPLSHSKCLFSSLGYKKRP